jgi:5-(carboxyamino)imidazole ribonucleotide synthase
VKALMKNLKMNDHKTVSLNQIPLPEGSVIGILGGGQLGRMIALAAAELGYRAHVFAPKGDAPACDVAAASTRADYDDLDALTTFGKATDTVTSEFENVPAQVMDVLSELVPVSPGKAALETAQHRIREKTLTHDLGIKTPRFAAIKTANDMPAAMANMVNGAILKTCRLGYDGKGQVHIKTGEDGIDAFNTLGSEDCILEEMINFTAEASFLVARNYKGEMSVFPASINQHEDGILAASEAPADPKILSASVLKDGQNAIITLAEKLDLIGILAVEMFITPEGLIFNEMAPRPHNSFHWTIEGTRTSQFAQLVRAITGLPLGSTKAMGRWRMDNILGQHMNKLNAALGDDGIFVHRYGKGEAKHDRKMAHLTRKIGD